MSPKADMPASGLQKSHSVRSGLRVLRDLQGLVAGTTLVAIAVLAMWRNWAGIIV